MTGALELLRAHHHVGVAALLLAGMGLSFLFLHRTRDRLHVYRGYVPARHPEAGLSRGDAPWLALAGAAFLFHVAVIFRLVGDPIVDGDSIGVILKGLVRGSVPLQIWGGRFFPLAHVDNIVLTILAGGYWIIRYYLVAHLAAAALLLFYCLDHLPARNRLVGVTLFLVLPPVVAIYSSPIYLERNVLLLLLMAAALAKVALRRARPQAGLLSLAMTCLFVSLFFKEPTVVAVGLVALASAWRTWRDHGSPGRGRLPGPGAVPLEALALLHCAMFAAGFFFYGGSPNPGYVEEGRIPVGDFLARFWPEAVLLAAFCLAMAARGRLDTFAVLFAASVPMALYSARLLRPFETYPYLNYALYVVFALWVAHLGGRRAARAGGALGLLLAAVSLAYTARYAGIVGEREEVVARIAEAPAVVLHMENDYRELQLARYLHHTGMSRDVGHVRDGGRGFCDEAALFSGGEGTCRLVDAPPPGALVVTDGAALEGGEELMRNGQFRVYRAAG